MPRNLPDAPVIRSNVEGSFAWEVLHRRHHLLIDHLLELHPYPNDIRHRLTRLRREITDGVVDRLPNAAHDRAAWDMWGDGCFEQPWQDAPSLWAESYFHRRVLEAVAFFRPGGWFYIDPFAPIKEAGLSGDPLVAGLRALGELIRLPASDGTLALLLAALWGNRLDLGFRLGLDAATGRCDAAGQLVADDTSTICDLLHDAAPGRIVLIADNAGHELLADLVLVDHLLRHDLASHVTLQLKPYPHFVSDAMPADMMTCLRVLGEARTPMGEVGHRLREAIRSEQLTLTSHWFFCSPESFHNLPDDLAAVYAGADLTILKGDLNYRRLVGDRHWAPDVGFPAVAAYFPGPVAALRVHKSEVVVGVDPARRARLTAEHVGWRVNGEYATAQLRA
ncbi:damage-control phosphatase ARMT1 family protein [Streptomyces nojiriensis]|uniref:damage-control phosphatase ARMT1 family protein n=1 Tax=Streptomyces nojiriensis TaxID=66374 RepID=UPI0036DBCD4C